MSKQEIIEKLKTRIELAESDIAMAANNFERDIAIVKKIFMNQTLGLIEQLDEPPQGLCEIKEFNKPRYPNDKKLKKYYGCSICEYDLGTLPCDTKFCPNCGRKIYESKMF